MLPVSTHVIYIATLPCKVWQALISGAQTRCYFGGRAVESTWAVGTPVVYREARSNAISIQGEVLEYDYPNRIRIALHDTLPSDGGFADAHITFELEALGEAVRMLVTQSLLAPDWDSGGCRLSAVLERLDWPAVLSSLKTMLETGEAIDITKLSKTRAEEAASEQAPLSRFFEHP